MSYHNWSTLERLKSPPGVFGWISVLVCSGCGAKIETVFDNPWFDVTLASINDDCETELILRIMRA